MKGLLRKDCYTALAACRTLILVALLFMVVSVFGNANYFFLLLPGFYLSIVGLTLYSLDESQGWLKYSLALPYGRDTIVTERYLFNLLISGLGVLFFLLFQLIRVLVNPGYTLSNVLYLVPFFLVFSLATPIFNLPLMFKLGAEKGRIAYIGFIALFSGAIVPLMSISREGRIDQIPAGSSLITLLVLLVLYALSWRCSIHFFRKREL